MVTLEVHSQRDNRVLYWTYENEPVFGIARGQVSLRLSRTSLAIFALMTASSSLRQQSSIRLFIGCYHRL